MANQIDFAKGHGMILQGKTRFARLTTTSGPDKLSENYSAELLLDENSVAALKAIKIFDYVTAKNPSGGEKYPNENVVRIKSNKVPRAYNRDQTPFDDIIGDGSMIRANVFIKKYDYRGKTGLTVYVNSFVMMNLVEYQPSNDDALFDDLSVPALTTEQTASVPTVDTTQAFDGGGNDDLPF